MSENQSRFAICKICGKEGEVVNQKYKQKEIQEQVISYSGNFVFKRICDECQKEYIHNHPEIKVRWQQG